MNDKAKIDDKIDWISPGFGLRNRDGVKRYVVQYKIGKQNRRITLRPGLTKPEATKEAAKIRGEVAKGNDPQGAKKAARATAAETFGAIVDRFLSFQSSRLRPSSLYSTRLYLKTHCKRLHALKIESVTRREIASILSSIADKSGATSADRARSALSAMFAWAMKEGLVDANPVFATNVYAGAVQRDRVLTPDEVVAIWNALPENDYGTIVKLLFYTAARPDEIAHLCWSEIDLKAQQIDLPAERSKNHRPFILPFVASSV